MRYSPYKNSMPPNIVVDGSPNDGTILTLSHWPKSGTPAELKADTSTEIALKYLESPAFHVACDLVTNNHFDEDGLVGLFALINPEAATRHRNLMIDVASAGDFGVFTSREAARISFAISAMAEPDSSPFPRTIFALPYPEMAAELYVRALALVPDLLAQPERFRSLWEAEDAVLARSEAQLKSGRIRMLEVRELDLSIVELPADVRDVHPMAIHNATRCTRILLMRGRDIEFRYRYETWVQLVSRRPPMRVDLQPLLVELNADERSGGTWRFEGVDAITPRLYLEAADDSSIPATVIRERLEHHLRTGPPAWNPFDG